MIEDLEKEWKVVLLERNKGGVKLTSDGLKLFPYAKSLIFEYEKLQMQFSCSETVYGLFAVSLKKDGGVISCSADFKE